MENQEDEFWSFGESDCSNNQVADMSEVTSSGSATDNETNIVSFCVS